MRAVIASLLDLPLADVPHFAAVEEAGGENFWLHVAGFCRAKGYSYVCLNAARFFWADDAIYHGITGPSPRGNGTTHIVVGRNGKVFHDPHPSRAGLAGDPNEWRFDFLVRTHNEGED